VNGHVYPEIDRLPGQGYRQPKVLFLNQGNGTFRDISQLAGPAVAVKTAARGCAFGDFDNDGSIDILINPINDVPQLLKCKASGDANWVTLKLVGTRSNRSAIGARVRCVTGRHEQVDEVRSGGSYMSQNDLRIHFGLGKAERADLVEIRWPSGLVERFSNVPVNRFLTIREGQGKWG
jgi:hypothetical protein